MGTNNSENYTCDFWILIDKQFYTNKKEKKMKLNNFCRFVLIILIFVYQLLSFSQTQERFDYFFIIDCSGSMVGEPAGSGNPVIFPDVQKSVKEFIDNIGEGASVTIMPFHRDVQDKFTVTITSHNSRNEVKRYIDNLKANGQVTWIYYSIKNALDQAKKLRELNRSINSQVILLYTDGKDNGPQDLDLDGILNYFKMQRGENRFLYLKYITLGVDLRPEEENKIKTTEGVELIKNPKGELQQKYMIEILPYMLDFGDLREIDEVTRTIILKFDQKVVGKDLLLSSRFPILDSLGVAYKILPERTKMSNEMSLTLKIFNKQTILARPPRAYEGKIFINASDECIFNPPELAIRFSMEPKKIIRIKTKDGKKLYHDFGKIMVPEEGKLESAWQFTLQYNEFALQEGVNVQIEIEGDTLNPKPFETNYIYLQTAGMEPNKSLKIIKDSEISLFLKIDEKFSDPGLYKGKIIVSTAEGVSLEGDGLKRYNQSTNMYYIPFVFEIISKPFPWIWLLFIPLFLALLAIFKPILYRSFHEGAILENSYGEIVSLKRKPLKRNYSVAGNNADFIMSQLPTDLRFKVRPLGRTRRNIFVTPEKNTILFNSSSEEISPNGILLEQDDYIQTSGENNIKIYYKLL